jgi:[NiFe] hydrogenase diaphorase moiety small subunit
VENNTDKLLHYRRNLIEMLFVEGNHFCMFCEKSGMCELQALGYRFGVLAPRYPYQFPTRSVDASHPDVMIDRNRCVLCGRCVRGSRDIDKKTVFEFTGRGSGKRIAVNAKALLGDTDLAAADRAVDLCPVGCIIRKRVGFKVPIGERKYDKKPIGTEIEDGRKASAQ